MKKKLKGFTLVELVIVMAMLTIIMYSVTQLVDPVSKYFVRSSNFESTTACIDNITRAIEGNLQYADRVRAFANTDPGTIVSLNEFKSGSDLLNTAGSTYVSAALQQQVQDFYTDYFENRAFLGCRGKIHVMIFDNESRPDNAVDPMSYTKLGDYSKHYANTGRIIMLSFDFDNYDPNKNTKDKVLNTVEAQGWYVNQKLYGNFDYKYTLGDASIDHAITTAAVTTIATVATTTVTTDVQTDESGNVITGTTTEPAATKPAAIVFNPSDFVIKIDMNEVRRSRAGGTLHLERILDETVSNTFACTMKNVLNNTNRYSTAGIDMILGATYTGDSPNPTGTPSYTVTRYMPRYDGLQTGSDTYTGFYFIYTLPDEILNLDSQVVKYGGGTTATGYAYNDYNPNAFTSYIITAPEFVTAAPTTTTA